MLYSMSPSKLSTCARRFNLFLLVLELTVNGADGGDIGDSESKKASRLSSPEDAAAAGGRDDDAADGDLYSSRSVSVSLDADER